MEPAEFTALVRDCKAAWRSLGMVGYDLKGSERGLLAFRRSLYAVADIAQGEKITPANVRSIRPGYGLPPKELPMILGQHARRTIRRGEPLSHALLMD